MTKPHHCHRLTSSGFLDVHLPLSVPLPNLNISLLLPQPLFCALFIASCRFVPTLDIPHSVYWHTPTKLNSKFTLDLFSFFKISRSCLCYVHFHQVDKGLLCFLLGRGCSVTVVGAGCCSFISSVISVELLSILVWVVQHALSKKVPLVLLWHRD